MELLDIAFPEREINLEFERYARDTSAALDVLLNTQYGIPADAMTHHDNGDIELTERTSFTNIGLAFPILAAQTEMELKDYEIAEHQAEKIVRNLQNMRNTGAYQNGLYNNWVYLDGTIYTPYTTGASSVDLAWAITGLEVGENYFKSLAAEIRQLREGIAYPKFFNPDTHLIYGELTFPKAEPLAKPWHYGRRRSEARQTAYVAGIYGLPLDIATYMDNSEQSDNGSMFVVSMPYIFDDEPLDPNRPYIEAHMADIGPHDIWGKSPCETPKGYKECGVSKLAINKMPEDEYIIAPYASFGAMPFGYDEKIMKNLKALETKFPDLYIEGFGFGDSVDLSTGDVVRKQLFLDLALSFLPYFNRKSGNKLHKLTPQINSVVSHVHNHYLH